jgi:hypothetical protein
MCGDPAAREDLINMKPMSVSLLTKELSLCTAKTVVNPVVHNHVTVEIVNLASLSEIGISDHVDHMEMSFQLSVR